MKERGFHVRIEEDLRRRFVKACQDQDLTASQVLRAFMRKFVGEYQSGRQQELFGANSNNTGQAR
jgi:hypothetical protein